MTVERSRFVLSDQVVDLTGGRYVAVCVARGNIGIAFGMSFCNEPAHATLSPEDARRIGAALINAATDFERASLSED